MASQLVDNSNDYFKNFTSFEIINNCKENNIIINMHYHYRVVARLIVLVGKGSPKMSPTRLMTFRTRNLDIWSQRRFLSSKVAFTS